MAHHQNRDPRTYTDHILGILQHTIEIRRGVGSAVSSRFLGRASGIVFPFVDRNRDNAGNRLQFTKLLCDHINQQDNHCEACGIEQRDASMRPLSIHVPTPPGLSQGEVMARIHVYKAYLPMSSKTNTHHHASDPNAALLAQIDIQRIHLCFTWVQLQARHLEGDQQAAPQESYRHYSSISIAMVRGLQGRRKKVIDCIVPVCRFFEIAILCQSRSLTYCRTLTSFEFPSSAW
jgi:hypothetical protein